MAETVSRFDEMFPTKKEHDVAVGIFSDLEIDKRNAHDALWTVIGEVCETYREAMIAARMDSNFIHIIEIVVEDYLVNSDWADS